MALLVETTIEPLPQADAAVGIDAGITSQEAPRATVGIPALQGGGGRQVGSSRSMTNASVLLGW
ncbi:hypothetical protein GCM10009835_39670 [Planosporangium flavigriseum]|uniref:Uncharacterized protein n=1 Tax=Planosporangium flavigriseum TaxID=373681 RepID=A0A8J3LLA2_9ACTN|nr:hypothetical protein Pfl04_10840 [Planosporangium flavigriseum]